jgi:hypothetical protein
MKIKPSIYGLLLVLATSLALADDKPTSLQLARAAAEANMRTPSGKAYYERLGTELVQKHKATIKSCKESAAGDLGSFWMFMKFDRDGTVREVLLDPRTKVGACARAALLNARFSPPPRASFWAAVNMKMAH